jgi:hypothetical protein
MNLKPPGPFWQLFGLRRQARNNPETAIAAGNRNIPASAAERDLAASENQGLRAVPIWTADSSTRGADSHCESGSVRRGGPPSDADS